MIQSFTSTHLSSFILPNPITVILLSGKKTFTSPPKYQCQDSGVTSVFHGSSSCYWDYTNIKNIDDIKFCMDLCFLTTIFFACFLTIKLSPHHCHSNTHVLFQTQVIPKLIWEVWHDPTKFKYHNTCNCRKISLHFQICPSVKHEWTLWTQSQWDPSDVASGSHIST